MRIKVLIADDHMMFRQGIVALLEAEEGIDVVGEAQNGARAIELSQELNPDVAVIDIAMPEVNGLIATRAMSRVCPDVKVLILSMHLNETYIAEAMKSGARGYVLKDCAVEELVAAIKAIADDYTYLSPKAATVVVKEYLGARNADESTLFDILSPREQEILQLVVEGKSSRDIAGQLSLSAKTVENHRASIMRKLDVHDLPSLVKYAIRTGLCEP